MEPLLEVKDLNKTFPAKGEGALAAVRHVTFQLHAGETLGIVGESGSGKSTLAKLVARLLDATSGTISLGGRDITAARGRELRRVYRDLQMVFQMPAGSFDPRRTIGYGVGESLRNSGLSKPQAERQVAQLLEQCGLPGAFAGRYPHELSAGQCQRAAIARALAIRPKLLICDEATSALDVTVQQQIVMLLTQLRAETGLSFLFICHNLALVQSFCDRVLVMHEGQVVETGTPEEVIASPRSEYTRNLLDAAL